MPRKAFKSFLAIPSRDSACSISFIKHFALAQGVGNDVILGGAPVFYFFWTVNQKVLGNGVMRKQPPQLGHLLAPALVAGKGLVLNDQEVQVRMGSALSLSIRPEQNNLQRPDRLNDQPGHFLKQFICYRRHLFGLSGPIPPRDASSPLRFIRNATVGGKNQVWRIGNDRRFWGGVLDRMRATVY